MDRKRLTALIGTACLTFSLTAAGCDRGSSVQAGPDPESGSPGVTAGDAYTWVKLAPSQGALQELVKAEVGKAAAKAQRPVVYLGAAWCDPCVALKKHRHDPLMTDAMRGAYVIEIDLDDWKLEDMKALGFRTGVVPIFHAVNSEGRATGPAVDGSSWGANVPASMAPPLKKFFAG